MNNPAPPDPAAAPAGRDPAGNTRQVWLVKTRRFPDAAVPARDEHHAVQLIRGFRATAARHQAQVTWEYGTFSPGVPGSYRRVGPRP